MRKHLLRGRDFPDATSAIEEAKHLARAYVLSAALAFGGV